MRKSGGENCRLCVNLVAAYGVRSFRKCLILRGRVLQVMRKPTTPRFFPGRCGFVVQVQSARAEHFT